MIKTRISAPALASLFTTGNTLPSVAVREGIPHGAVLQRAEVEDGDLVLYFGHESGVSREQAIVMDNIGITGNRKNALRNAISRGLA